MIVIDMIDLPPTVGDIVICRPATKLTGGHFLLEEVTFIIPVYIESSDRLTNFKTVYRYLKETLKTNIIIYEWNTKPVVNELIGEDVTYIFEKNDGVCFHRTRCLNYMLNIVKTPVTVNYDVDIILEPDTYILCRDAIMFDHDMIYPYEYGYFQNRVSYSGRDKLLNGYSLTDLIDADYISKNVESWSGHCQFLNTNFYKKYGWENENFISYGCEDFERFYRFSKFANKVGHLKGNYVYHLEHTRGDNSLMSNPYYDNNVKLWETLNKMSKDQLTEYYKSVNYISKYTT